MFAAADDGKSRARTPKLEGVRFEKSSRFSVCERVSSGDERASVPVCLYVMGLSLSSALHWRGGFSCRHAAASRSLLRCFAFYLVFPAATGCITWARVVT